MKDKLPCSIIQDLLPKYLEGLGSEKTREYVEEHLKSCNKCSKIANKLNDKGGKIHKYNIKNRTSVLFVVLLLIGLAITGISICCTYVHRVAKSYSIVDITNQVSYSILIYLMPCLALFVSIITLKANNKKDNYWPKVITVFLFIGIATLAGFIIYKLICILFINNRGFY